MASTEVNEADDLGVLRRAHKRLSDMGYELSGEDGEAHPLDWWEAQRRSDWAHALDATAQQAARAWAEQADTLGFIGFKHHHCPAPCECR